MIFITPIAPTEKDDDHISEITYKVNKFELMDGVHNTANTTSSRVYCLNVFESDIVYNKDTKSMLLAVPFLPTPIKNHKSFSSLKTQHFWHEEHHIKNDDVDIRPPNVFHSEIDDNKNTKSLTPPFL